MDGPLAAADLDGASDTIASTPATRAVILTKGDPMTLSARRLAAIMDRVCTIGPVHVVRRHARRPEVAQERVMVERLAAITGRPVT